MSSFEEVVSRLVTNQRVGFGSRAGPLVADGVNNDKRLNVGVLSNLLIFFFHFCPLGNVC